MSNKAVEVVKKANEVIAELKISGYDPKRKFFYSDKEESLKITEVEMRRKIEVFFKIYYPRNVEYRHFRFIKSIITQIAYLETY